MNTCHLDQRYCLSKHHDIKQQSIFNSEHKKFAHISLLLSIHVLFIVFKVYGCITAEKMEVKKQLPVFCEIKLFCRLKMPFNIVVERKVRFKILWGQYFFSFRV